MVTVTRWTVTILAAAAVAACDVADGGLVGPQGEAAVAGRVEQETETFEGGSGAQRAETVEVARVNANGSLSVIAQGTVSSVGAFRVEPVPTGRSDLTVVARSSTGAEVGRVLLAGETHTGGALVAAPINAETTVHALVYSELRAMGRGAAEVSAAELALQLRLDAATAAAVARSRSEVRALASASAEATETTTRAHARLGQALSVQARQRLLLTAHAEHQARLHHRVNAEAAYDAFLDAATEAMIRGGASADAVVLATAAARVSARQTLAASAAARSTQAAMARGSARLNLAARTRLLAGLPAAAARERSAAAEALAFARLRVRAASSPEEVDGAMADADARARQAIFFELTTPFFGVDGETFARFEAALTAAFEVADLQVALSGSASAAARADAVAQYRQRVQAAARACADAAPLGAGAKLDAAVTFDLLLAARAG